MVTLRDVFNYMWRNSLKFIALLHSKFLEFMTFVICILEFQFGLLLEETLSSVAPRFPMPSLPSSWEHILRWVFTPVSSSVDVIRRRIFTPVSASIAASFDDVLLRCGCTPLYDFYPQHHPRLHTIRKGISDYLCSATAHPQIITAFHMVLLRMYDERPDLFSAQPTIANIRQCFTDHWPHIRPLDRASCLNIPEEGISMIWGQIKAGFEPPTLWINPYLIRALEAAEEGTEIEIYLRFLTIVTMLHEAMHLLVYYILSGQRGPQDDAGFRLERKLFDGGVIIANIHRVDMFKLDKDVTLGLYLPPVSKVIGEQTCREILRKFEGNDGIWDSPTLDNATLNPLPNDHPFPKNIFPNDVLRLRFV